MKRTTSHARGYLRGVGGNTERSPPTGGQATRPIRSRPLDIARITAATNNLTLDDLDPAAFQIECLTGREPGILA
jgi:hypothetical protein